MSKTVEEIEDEIKSLSRKRDKHLIQANEIQEQLLKLAEEMYEINPKYVKVDCLICGGKGYIQTEENKKVKCNVCEMKSYIWAKVYEG